jgi:hypothetical protein
VWKLVCNVLGALILSFLVKVRGACKYCHLDLSSKSSKERKKDWSFTSTYKFNLDSDKFLS